MQGVKCKVEGAKWKVQVARHKEWSIDSIAHSKVHCLIHDGVRLVPYDTSTACYITAQLPAIKHISKYIAYFSFIAREESNVYRPVNDPLSISHGRSMDDLCTHTG